MSKIKKLYDTIMGGSSDKNLFFADLQVILKEMGFTERIRGDHHIYSKSGIAEIVNIQPTGNKAKPYQVKQVRNLILKYNLEVKND